MYVKTAAAAMGAGVGGAVYGGCKYFNKVQATTSNLTVYRENGKPYFTFTFFSMEAYKESWLAKKYANLENPLPKVSNWVSYGYSICTFGYSNLQGFKESWVVKKITHLENPLPQVGGLAYKGYSLVRGYRAQEEAEAPASTSDNNGESSP